MGEILKLAHGTDEASWRRLIGKKVSVRFRLHDDPEHSSSEIVGVVQAVREGGVEVVDRRGKVARFAFDDLIAGKTWT